MLNSSIISSFIAPAKNKKTLVKKQYVTSDIITEVLEADKKSWLDTIDIMLRVPLTTESELCADIWNILKHDVKYQVDVPGDQLVKSPSALWSTGFGDCKSYSIFTASLLKNYGIPYTYRFVSFSNSPIPTHVYIIAHTKQGNIIIDAVWHYFNSEKKFTFKIDKNMAGLYRVEGIGKNGLLKKIVKYSPTGIAVRTARKVSDKVFSSGAKKATTASNAMSTAKSRVMSWANNRPKSDYKPTQLRLFSSHPHDRNMAVIKQRMEVERDIVRKKRGVAGIGKIEHYDKVIGVIDEWIGASERNDYMAMARILKRFKPGSREHKYLQKGLISKIDDDMSIPDYDTVEGIGKISLKKIVKGAGKVAKGAAKGVAKGAKAVAKGAVKVVRAGESVITRPLLEVALPSASPYFIYEFIDSKQLGPKAQKKQNKAHNLFKAIVNVTGVKADTVRGIIRNGIMKRFKKSPENVIADWKKSGSSKVSGIGAVDPATINVIFDSINKVIDLVKKVLGKGKVEEVKKEDMPGADDFETATSPRDGSRPAGSGSDDSDSSGSDDSGYQYKTGSDSVDNKQTGGMCGGGGARK